MLMENLVMKDAQTSSAGERTFQVVCDALALHQANLCCLMYFELMCDCLQMQTKEVPTRVQEELSGGEDRCSKAEVHSKLLPNSATHEFCDDCQKCSVGCYKSGCREAMHRGVPKFQDGLDFRGALHWMRNLCEGSSSHTQKHSAFALECCSSAVKKLLQPCRACLLAMQAGSHAFLAFHSHSALFEALSFGYQVQKCPFDAIMIINLPKNLERETTHRYGPNSFKLHRCCSPLSLSSGDGSWHACRGRSYEIRLNVSVLTDLSAITSLLSMLLLGLSRLNLCDIYTPPPWLHVTC